MKEKQLREINTLYLSQYFHDHWHHSVLFGEALVRHVPGRPTGADKDVSAGRLEGDILHVGSHPAVRLTKHSLWSQSGSHQKDVFAFHAAVERPARVSGTVLINMRIILETILTTCHPVVTFLNVGVTVFVIHYLL